MEGTLFVYKPFRYEKGNTDCSCHEIIRFQHGDLLHIAGDPFYVDSLGWYIAVQKNDSSPFYMAAHFIDDLYEKQALYTKMDLTLAMNYHKYKVNEALDRKEKKVFLQHSKAFDRFKALHPEFTPVLKE
ncbi:hypothetical protein [Halobacillus sp. KGW1]|uniref:hypothetical protein n=1 Tax=Halobacillus sp. KGW1 TaxID=1793726 RepID=UPI000785CB90|nr:hypothetical protein [Halobacillus sp. KGW1]